MHVDQDDLDDLYCKVLVDHDFDVDALSDDDDDEEHDVDEAVFCCSLSSLVDIVVVEVIVVDELLLDDPDEDVLCKVLVDDESCTVLNVDL